MKSVAGDITTEVMRVIGKHLGLDAERLNRRTMLLDDLGVDSLAIVNLVLKVEDTLRVEIPAQDMESMQTVGDVISSVEKHWASRGVMSSSGWLLGRGQTRIGPEQRGAQRKTAWVG